MARRQQWALPLAAVLVVMLTAALHARGHLSRLESAVAEARARMLAHEADSDIVIVGIDSHSLSELSEWPWPRRHYARLMQHLDRAAPSRVFLDIDFSSRSPDPDDDALFENALASWRGSPVLLATHFRPLGDGEDIEPGSVIRPLERFAEHTQGAAVVLEPDRDGLVRAFRSSWRVGDENIRAVFDADSKLVDGSIVTIDFSILPSSFDYVPFSDLLNGEIDPASLRGKTVYVGALAVELRDSVTVPVHRTLPGVALQAIATETVRAGVLRSPPAWAFLALLAAWSAACTVLLNEHAWRRNALVLAGGLALLGVATLYLYSGYRIDLPVVPFAVVLASLFVLAALRSLDIQTWRAIAYAIRLRRRDALLKSIVESTTDAIVCIEASGAIRTANFATSHLFGCPPQALPGAHIGAFVPGLSSNSTGSPPAAGAITEHEAVTPDGRRIPVEVSVSRVAVDDARLFTVIIRDVSERKAQQRQLEYQATHDPLTALPNRTALYQRLDVTLSKMAGNRRVALMLLDLGRFSEVNDTLGHDVGDEVLAEAARRIASLDPEAFVARIGADEFTVVLAPVASREEIDDAATTLLERLKEPFHVHGIAVDVGATIGIALSPDHAQDAKELLRRADVAMYGAKRRGSAWEYYDQDHDRHTVRRLGMISELRGALSSDGLKLHYQPQVNLGAGRVEAVEALIRWHHPILGDVRPDEFIGLAESSHLIRPVTWWTVHQALTDIGAWNRRGSELRVAVNLSARMLQDETLAEQLDRLLDAYSVKVGQLELEITESAMMLDPERARRVVRDLHALGVTVSVDDYGTGFSSLGYLRDLKVSALKLDKSFVLDLETRDQNRVIVESTVHLAHALNLGIVAEGIETAWVRDYLAGIGYDFGQGYLFSRALPADECLAWISAFNAAPQRRAG